eukprot:COSAG01_NODE_3838_length_5647_cov_14.881399_5_plen_55_part_00
MCAGVWWYGRGGTASRERTRGRRRHRICHRLPTLQAQHALAPGAATAAAAAATY